MRIDAACRNLPASEQTTCSLERFRQKPFVVIAFVDTGINPYHRDFRAPDFVHHPSKFIEGYPKSAAAINLDLKAAGARGYAAARRADVREWASTEAGELYWFPGTRVIGGISIEAGGTSNPEFGEFPILDDQGHGTGVASVAAGQFFGSNPEALIVMIEGLGDASLEWATSQKWIDIVSNSWGNRANLPVGDTEASREATRRGQTVAFAAGNGATNTNSSMLFPPEGPIDDPCKCKTPDPIPRSPLPTAGRPGFLPWGRSRRSTDRRTGGTRFRWTYRPSARSGGPRPPLESRRT
ncbi:MAG: S8/S53 family peptidase [Actinomycetota bacterium]